MYHRPELQLLPDNWIIISDEMKSIKDVHPTIKRYRTADYNELHRDIYDEVIAFEGWSGVFDSDDKWWNFPLFTFGEPTKPACKMTPKTVDILTRAGGVSFAAFSLLSPLGIVTPHVDTSFRTSRGKSYISSWSKLSRTLLYYPGRQGYFRREWKVF